MKEAVARLQRVKWVNDVQHSCNTTCPVQWAAEKYRRLALAQDDQKNAKRVRQLGEHFSTRDVVWHLFEERLAPHTKTLDEFLPKRDELIDGQIDVRTWRSSDREGDALKPSIHSVLMAFTNSVRASICGSNGASRLRLAGQLTVVSPYGQGIRSWTRSDDPSARKPWTVMSSRA